MTYKPAFHAYSAILDSSFCNTMSPSLIVFLLEKHYIL